jgi:hypothetical protein
MPEGDQEYFCTSTALGSGFYTWRINFIGFEELWKEYGGTRWPIELAGAVILVRLSSALQKNFCGSSQVSCPFDFSSHVRSKMETNMTRNNFFFSHLYSGIQ